MTHSPQLQDSFSRLIGMGFEQERVPHEATDLGRVGRRTHKLAAERPAMGTGVAITALGAGPDRLEEAVGRAFEEMDRLIAIFTRFESASALSQLNDFGRLAAPPPELAHVLDRAARYHAATHGVFDVTVAPLVDLFRERWSGPTGGAPSEAEIREARARVGAREVHASSGAVRFGRAEMRVTLDGIAKGYIADRMAAVLEKHRVRSYLVDAGGDVRTRGRKEGRQPWTVAVRDPGGGGVLPDVLSLTRGAVATSGSYEIFFDAKREFHHIVDGAAGRSPADATSVTVLAPTAMAADALATSVFVLGPAGGVALVDSLARCECLILDRGGRRHRSRGWKSAPLVPLPTE